MPRGVLLVGSGMKSPPKKTSKTGLLAGIPKVVEFGRERGSGGKLEERWQCLSKHPDSCDTTETSSQPSMPSWLPLLECETSAATTTAEDNVRELHKNSQEEEYDGDKLEASEKPTAVAEDSTKDVWKEFEPQLLLLKDWIDLYTKAETYGMDFNEISNVIKDMKRSLKEGKQIPRLAITIVLCVIDELLTDHEIQMVRRKEEGKFDKSLLATIIDTCCTLKSVVYGLSGDNSNVEGNGSMDMLVCNIAEELNSTDEGSIETVEASIASSKHSKGSSSNILCDTRKTTATDSESIGLRTQTYVSAQEQNNCASEAGSLFSTESERAMRREYLERYKKMEKDHDISIMMLPHVLRLKVLKHNSMNKKAIKEGTLSSDEEWEKVEKIVGKLRPNREACTIIGQAESGWNLDRIYSLLIR